MSDAKTAAAYLPLKEIFRNYIKCLNRLKTWLVKYPNDIHIQVNTCQGIVRGYTWLKNAINRWVTQRPRHNFTAAPCFPKEAF